MESWMKDGKGRMRRVRKRYVDVVARMREDGFMEPLSVAWRDGRSFRVTEVAEAGEFRPGFDGVFTARYRIRIGDRRTSLYLEQRLNRPETGLPPSIHWWVHEFE